MASARDTATFFLQGNSQQFEHVLNLYPQALKLKAEKRTKKPEELIKLDNWYQNELPKKIKSRGKDAHLIHEELVQMMKWKQTRGKFYPQLSYLVKVNTPRAVMAETKKAFRKLPNLEQAITALSNLKGVGTTMASALLCAAAPETAPFMADECLMAIPEIEGIDYTTKEYLNFVQHIQATVDRLNNAHVKENAVVVVAENEDTNVDTTTVENDTDSAEVVKAAETEEAPVVNNKKKDNSKDVVAKEEKYWSPHRVELALWTHYIVSDLRPELLDTVPGFPPLSRDDVTKTISNGTDNGTNTDMEPSDESNQEPINGKVPVDVMEDSTTSFTEDSLDKPPTPLVTGDETSDSANSLETPVSLKRPAPVSTDDDDNSRTNSSEQNNVRHNNIPDSTTTATSVTSTTVTADDVPTPPPTCKKPRTTGDVQHPTETPTEVTTQ